MYDVILWKRTGYNGTNIPDGPAILSTALSETLPATDIMQQYFLSSVTVRANWKQVEDADYCQISDAFYFITGISMTSPDVAVLSLSMDFITTLGGVANITDAGLLDGIVSRAHVSDDTFGKWTAGEPFTPNQPLEIVEGSLLGDKGDNNDYYTLLLSTVDLSDTGTTASTYKDDVTGTEVTVPQLKATGQNARVDMKTNSGTRSTYYPNCAIFNGKNTTVKKNVNKARALGEESAILGQWNIPSIYVDTATWSPSADDPELNTGISSKFIEASSGLPFEYDKNVKNKKTLYGDFNQYLVVSMGAGNQTMFKPEDIQDGGTEPSFVIYSDLRYQQAPYCRPKSYLKDTTNLYLQATPGQPWADAPLRYEGKSGAWFESAYQDAERDIRSKNNQYRRDLIDYGKPGDIHGLWKSRAGQAAREALMKFSPLQMPLASAFGFAKTQRNTSAELSAMNSVATNGGGYDINEYAGHFLKGDIFNTLWNQEAGVEKNEILFAGGQTVAPAISFPRSDTLRDYFGNGFKIYRYRLSDIDLKTYDKFLTMYGYSLTKTLEHNDFFNRKYFNYVQCSDVSISGESTSLAKPRWMCEGAAAQLRGGVRVWHVAPNANYYTSGNPIEEVK